MLLLPEFLLGFLVQVSSCLSLSLLLLSAFVACVCCLRLLLKFHLLLELCFFQLHLLSLLNFVPLIRSLIAECMSSARETSDSLSIQIFVQIKLFFIHFPEIPSERERPLRGRPPYRPFNSPFTIQEVSMSDRSPMQNESFQMTTPPMGVRISIFQHTHFKIFENISRTFQNIRKVLQATL